MLPMIKITTARETDEDMRGFTLLEVMISMIVIGLLVAPFLQIYSNYLQREKMRITDEHVRQASAYIQSYRTANGAYPCPAQMTAPSSNANYGVAVDCSAGGATYDPPLNLTAGNCLNGICMEQAIASRVAGAPLVGTEINVIVGALPYRDLQMEEEGSLDGYGSRLLYAVTYSMTNRTTLDDVKGAISILDNVGNPRVIPDGSVDYLILSTGKTRQGGYTREGLFSSSCVGGTLDSQNCNPGFEGGVATTNSIYVDSLRNEVAGLNFYDDVIEYGAQERISPWKRTDANPEDIESLIINNTGVGVPNPSQKLTISALNAGDPPALRVSGASGNNGKILTDQVCDLSGNCFRPENIAGNNASNPGDEVTTGDGMKCPAGEYMVGIQNGVAICENDIEVICPTSTPVLVDPNPGGAPVCVGIPAASCPAATIALCPGHSTTPDVFLPLAGDGANTGFKYAGDCRKRKYRCDAGIWIGFNSSGACTSSSTSTTTPLCTSVYGYGSGLTTYTNNTATTCSSANNTLLTDCTCIGASAIRNCPPCPSGHSGTVPTYNRERFCSGNVLNWWWTPVNGAGNPSSISAECGSTSGYCSCVNPAILTRTVPRSCSNVIPAYPNPGQMDPVIGDSPRQPQVWDSGICGWVNSGPVIGTCACKTGNIIEASSIPCTACDRQNPVSGSDHFLRDPVTCGKLSPAVPLPAPPSVLATCAPSPHYWRKYTDTNVNVNLITRKINDPCNCLVYPPAQSKACKSTLNTTHACHCLP